MSRAWRLAYALGAYSVFQGVLYAAVPYLDKARSPGQAVLLFHFGLLVVAAYGADALSTASVWSKRLVRGLVVAGGLVWLALLLLQLRGVEPSGRAQSMMLASVAPFLIALSIRLQSRIGILLILLTEVSAGTSYLIHRRTNPQNPTLLDRFAQHRGVVQFLRSQTGPFRFHADDQEIPENLGDWEGLEQSAGYLASVSADLYDFIGLDWNRMPLLLNQVYFVGKERSRPEQVEMFSEPGRLKVFRNPDASPRAWLASRVRGVPDRAAAIRLVQSPNYNPQREAFVFGRAPDLEACDGAGSVTLLRQEIHRVEARVNAPCRAMVVLRSDVSRLEGASGRRARGALCGLWSFARCCGSAWRAPD